MFHGVGKGAFSLREASIFSRGRGVGRGPWGVGRGAWGGFQLGVEIKCYQFIKGGSGDE